MVDVKDLQNIDLYALLGVNLEVTQNDIKKAYRKKALECHPDKNPDNPKAAELFHQLSKALEILSDPSAKAAYDKLLNAKKAAQLRHQQLDSKRQKLKADLEAREKLAEVKSKSYKRYETQTPEELLQAEIIRLRKEGSKLLEEEQNYLKEQIRIHKSGEHSVYKPADYRIKIKWNASKTDSNNGGYSEDNLKRFLMKYGDIEALIMSKKKGRAIVEFKSLVAAEMAVAYEKGLEDNHLHLKWVGPPPGQATKNVVGPTLVTERDFESLVLRQMRQAEERKKLIEQMKSSDD